MLGINSRSTWIGERVASLGESGAIRARSCASEAALNLFAPREFSVTVIFRVF
jgi:hypothetical protein